MLPNWKLSWRSRKGPAWNLGLFYPCRRQGWTLRYGRGGVRLEKEEAWMSVNRKVFGRGPL
jgi:hypothetical protein